MPADARLARKSTEAYSKQAEDGRASKTPQLPADTALQLRIGEKVWLDLRLPTAQEIHVAVVFWRLMNETQSPIHIYRRRIEFVDTDVSGNIHFSRFFVFMETAEHEMLRSLGTTVHLEDGERTIGWPRVEARCKYLAPVRFGDVIEVRVFVSRQGTKSMTYRFEFHCRGQQVAEGEMSSVCCVLGDSGALRAIAIPDVIADKIRAALSVAAASEETFGPGDIR